MKKRTFKTEMKLSLCEPVLNKNNTLEEYSEQLLDEEYYSVKATCSIAFIMNDKEFTHFKNNLLKSFDFLKDVPCGYSCFESFIQDVVMVVNEETKQRFFVNTQGYSYARYCLFD